MRTANIGIFSQKNDLHARTIMHRLRERQDVKSHFFASDDVLESGGLHWNPAGKAGFLRSFDGEWVRVSELHAVWWRRVNQPQKHLDLLPDEITRDLVNQEWKAAIFGLMCDSFRGRWINDPTKDVLAGNKLYQLDAASVAGLRVPRSLVSQQPDGIRAFCEACGGRIIVKKLVGTTLQPLATVLLGTSDLDDDVSLQLCPSLYQEYVVGSRHLRVCCFGSTVHSVLIHSKVLDWRRDLSGPFSPYDLDDAVKRQLVDLVARLGLRMAIMDMMIDKEDLLWWIELNTQGQFLFSEALSGYDLTTRLVDFLITEGRDEMDG